jgi:hypothetical protein
MYKAMILGVVLLLATGASGLRLHLQSTTLYADNLAQSNQNFYFGSLSMLGYYNSLFAYLGGPNVQNCPPARPYANYSDSNLSCFACATIKPGLNLQTDPVLFDLQTRTCQVCQPGITAVCDQLFAGTYHFPPPPPLPPAPPAPNVSTTANSTVGVGGSVGINATAGTNGSAGAGINGSTNATASGGAKGSAGGVNGSTNSSGVHNASANASQSGNITTSKAQNNATANATTNGTHNASANGTHNALANASQNTTANATANATANLTLNATNITTTKATANATNITTANVTNITTTKAVQPPPAPTVIYAPPTPGNGCPPTRPYYDPLTSLCNPCGSL